MIGKIGSFYRKLIYLIGKKTSLIPDRCYLKAVYKRVVGRNLNLKNPIEFSEKIQYLKLYNRKPEYTSMVDKELAKKYVSEIIGEEYIIPTIGVWKHFSDIDFSSLPNRFVLKCTHDSGSVILCKDKDTFDFDNAKKVINKKLKYNFYLSGREWPYKNVEPKIIAEPYLEDKGSKELKDYKFYCFDGIPRYCQVISDRFSGETIDFFDMNWEHQEFTGLLDQSHIPFSKTRIHKPKTFNQMKEAAEKLAAGIPFVRIDFYEINNAMFFGEITFFPASGFGYFTPYEWNAKLGDLIPLK